ncbi:MAG: transposase [Lentisphaeria bacterium]
MFTSLTLDTIDIDATLSEVVRLFKEDTTISPALKSLVSILIAVIKLLTNRIGLNSRNSSKPPSSDVNPKKQERKKFQKKNGGQLVHVGTTLIQIEGPDDIELVQIDRRTLPKGNYENAGIEKRQVFDITISRWVFECQAEY